MTSLEIIFCPACGEEIFRQVPYPIEGHLSLPRKWEGSAADALTAMHEAAERTYQDMRLKAENACIAHIQERHPLRYWLWRRTGWNHVVTFRLRGRAKSKYPDDVQTYVFGGLDK